MAAAGRAAAKVLGINLDYRKEEPVSGAASISSVETCECIPGAVEQLLTSK
jgi:sodium-independent sulfate anion transporter 11